MHGLINRSIQCFVRDTYGPENWSAICSRADLDFEDFEALLSYDDAVTEAVLAAASDVLGKDRAPFLEDLGHYLITHPGLDALRRLLRFGGETFVDFLLSLDDLHDRGKLALPDLDLPKFEVRAYSATAFSLIYRWGDLGVVVLGVLRAMADEYGALVLMEHIPPGVQGEHDTITIELLEVAHAAGRRFDLGQVSA